MQPTVPPPTSPVDTCVFCHVRFGDDRARRSEDHIWPRALWPLLPGQPEGFHRARGLGGHPPHTSTVVRNRQIFHDLKPRVVCRGCNNGWISELDTYVKDNVFRPAYEGKQPSMSAVDTARLAAWAFAKVAVADHQSDSGPPATHPQERDWVYRHRTAPPSVTTWLGVHATGDAALSFHKALLRRQFGNEYLFAPAYAVTHVVGTTILVTIGGGVAGLQPPPPLRSRLVLLEGPTEGPAESPFTTEEVPLLAHSILARI